jgi:hypothetical protein
VYLHGPPTDEIGELGFVGLGVLGVGRGLHEPAVDALIGKNARDEIIDDGVDGRHPAKAPV